MQALTTSARAWPHVDVDIVTLQNPFNFLARDSDIEGLSDGFDERTAYGAPPPESDLRRQSRLLTRRCA
jgi:hypothetical protein